MDKTHPREKGPLKVGERDYIDRRKLHLQVRSEGVLSNGVGT